VIVITCGAIQKFFEKVVSHLTPWLAALPIGDKRGAAVRSNCRTSRKVFCETIHTIVFILYMSWNELHIFEERYLLNLFVIF
jgi:hypothetical protein